MNEEDFMMNIKVVSGEFITEETDVDVDKRVLLDEYTDRQLVDWCASDNIMFANLNSA